jgi:hypothetical protein
MKLAYLLSARSRGSGKEKPAPEEAGAVGHEWPHEDALEPPSPQATQPHSRTAARHVLPHGVYLPPPMPALTFNAKAS